jgi:iron complex outermembrane recepter protein
LVGQVTASSVHGGKPEKTKRGFVAGRQRRILVSGSLAVLLLAASAGARSQSDSVRQGLAGNGHGGIFLAQSLPARDLSGLSLEQLGSIVVTSVSRRRERLSDVSSSIYVISAQDIHRAGATTLGEALRLAPNLNVAQADTAQYAISARGFNNVLANKMLVLIDGRTVYSPLFSGVFWESQDVMLEDVDRIEVISGPGATIWGSNAVNGVINIITLPARATQGGLLSLGAGNRERTAAARYGGQLGDRIHYRVYAKKFEFDPSERADGVSLQDRQKHTQAGLRAEWRDSNDQLTLIANVYEGDIGGIPGRSAADASGILGRRDFSGSNVLGRWNRQLASGGTLRVRTYFDRTDRDHAASFSERLETYDLEVQHSLRRMGAHRLTWGAGHRESHDRVGNSAAQAFIPASRSMRWRNLFLQDEIALQADVSLTLGLKVEQNPFTDSEKLPSARIAWRFAPNHTAWAGLSRAVRAPSRIDREVYLPGTEPYLLAGNTTFRAEVSDVLQLGYRGQPTPALSWSATLFHHDHSRLRSLQPQPGGAIFANDFKGETIGLETWASYRVNRAWRLSGGLVLLDQDLRLESGAIDAGGVAALGNDPSHWWSLRSSFDLSSRQHLDVMIRRVGGMRTPPVPAYTAVDVRYGWTITPDVEAGLVIRNLTDSRHAEWGHSGMLVEHERSALVQVSWRL